MPLKKKPTEYLKQLYYDSIVFTPEALKTLIAEVGVDKIMMGTDYPFPWTRTSVDHILNTPGLSDADRPRCSATPRRGCWGSSRPSRSAKHKRRMSA